MQLDTEQRPLKSPRAFCAPVHVPDEVYLVIPRHGGRDDYAALFHEAGHTEHYAHVDASLPFEYRHLGDNSVTEGFAFLLEHLTEDPAWLEATLGVTRRRASTPATCGRASSCSCAATRRSCRTSWSCTAASGRSSEMPDALRRPARRRARGRMAVAHVAVGRGPRLLRRQLPARVGIRDAPAQAAARALRAGVVRANRPRERCCARSGARASASTPTSCSPR